MNPFNATSPSNLINAGACIVQTDGRFFVTIPISMVDVFCCCCYRVSTYLQINTALQDLVETV